MPRVKICGVTDERSRDAVVDSGADAVGFLVDVPGDNPRAIDAQLAQSLIAGTPPFVSSVLVTMAHPPARLIDLIQDTGAETIQLHGNVTAEHISAIKGSTRATVLVSIEPIDPRLEPITTDADAIVLDRVRPDGTGGTGDPIDWSLARSVVDRLDSPVILAGGLTPANITRAIDQVRPFAVDVSSGVEETPGRKDPAAIDRFVDLAQRHQEVPT